MKVKVRDLTGLALDWAVAKCKEVGKPAGYFTDAVVRGNFNPSINWSAGGPIIELEEIGTKRSAPCMKDEQWEATGSPTAKGVGYTSMRGKTPLVAAMRCYVASKLGEEIDVPEEMLA